MRTTLLFIAFILASICQAQDSLIVKYSKTITGSDLEKHLKIIASDEYQGRETGDKGLEMAAKYVTNGFQGDKLNGPVQNSENTYYQEFELEKKNWSKIEIAAGKEKFESFKDIAFIELSEGTNEFDVVFAGYGIYSDKYNEYKNIDVKGKIVAMILGEPKNKNGIYLTTGTTEPKTKIDTTINGKFGEATQAKIMASMMRGAKGLIFIEDNDKEAIRTINKLKEYMGGSQVSFPGQKEIMKDFYAGYMSPTQAARLFGTNKKKYDKILSDSINKGVSPSGKWTQKLKIEAVRKIETIKSGNVLGFIEGTDKKEEIVVLCAHYDHIGIKDGVVYNGADDNGSGTVALLELAEAFSIAKANGNGPRRSILFIALTGEEKGLLGSKYYAKNPIFQMSNTVTALNIDMIGRIDDKHSTDSNYIYLIGSDYKSTELHALSEECAKTYTPELIIDYKYNDKNDPERLYYRSDQISFAEKGVPVIFYTDGEHPDYHKPTDDVDKIDFKIMEKRVQLVFVTAWQLANREDRVKVDK